MDAAETTRRCLATGETADKVDLVRFALAPDGRVVPDLAERLPGRGAWVSPAREALDDVVAKGLFARGFKTRALADADLADTVERLLVARVSDLLGFARRAGEAVTGFEKCRAALGHGDALLLHARDGSMDGLRKLAGAETDMALRVLDGAELGAPFGRDQAVHVALTRGGLAKKILRECSRLAGFRTAGDGLKEGR
ncbi:MAG: RNA-binding protein [Alphaproteobacteria bacterium]|nr:RNA-binding protein [Alphaproteobacteria bacterium]